MRLTEQYWVRPQLLDPNCYNCSLASRTFQPAKPGFSNRLKRNVDFRLKNDGYAIARLNLATLLNHAHHASLSNKNAPRFSIQHCGKQARLKVVNLRARVSKAGDSQDRVGTELQLCSC